LWRNGGDGPRVYFAGPMVTLRRREKVFSVPEGKNLERILRDLGILPDTVLVVQNGKIVPLDYRPKDGEEFEIIDVISGG